MNIILTYFLIEETLQKRVSHLLPEAGNRLRANLQSVKYVITHSDVLKISILLCLFQFTWSSYYQFISPILKTFYQFSLQQLSLFIGMLAFWLIIGAGPIFKLLHGRITQQQILITSALLEVTGIVLTLTVYYGYLPDIIFWLAAIRNLFCKCLI